MGFQAGLFSTLSGDARDCAWDLLLNLRKGGKAKKNEWFKGIIDKLKLSSAAYVLEMKEAA